MKRTAILALVLSAFAFISRARATIAPVDDRSSEFVAGAIDPAEAFGQVEGALLIGLALAAIAAIFILSIVTERIHSKCENLLNRVEARLKERDKTDG